MFTLRATSKLLKRMKATPDASPPPPTGLLGDWYANVHLLRPAHLVLAVSERTLLPVVVPAREMRDLPERIALAAGDVLRAIGVSEEQVIRELRHMCEWNVAKTNNRSVLGTMNDFAWMMEAGDGETTTLLERALLLARCPCGPLEMDSPREATVALFAAAQSPSLVLH